MDFRTLWALSAAGLADQPVCRAGCRCPWHHRGMDGTRIDRWLWAVRLAKTRSLAAQACRAGHVQINGARAKPAAPVNVGDTVRARLGGRERVVEVARLPGSRVGAEPAAACLIDRSPPPPPRDPLAGVGPRGRGAGRPTKRDRRQLDQARGRRA
jgi:ribosome-associated heat shock protein Hsp15